MTRIGSQGILSNATLIYESETFRQVLHAAERMAACERPVVLEGETGTGKGRVARIIHELSSRRGGPFTTWNAAEANASLASSELFGVTKGSYTGAVRDAAGIIESAAGGTLVIDDVDKLPPVVQSLLLRFLDEWSIRRTGSNSKKAVNVRLICTTNRNLRLLVRDGAFLPDLAYRLLGLRLVIPALRSRPEDIMPLVRDFAKRAAEDEGNDPPTFTPQAVALLEADPWPGNVREVAEVVQNLVFQTAPGGVIDGVDVCRVMQGRLGTPVNAELELARLRALPLKDRRSPMIVARAFHLAEDNGAKASQLLGIPIRSFRRYLRQAGLTRRSNSYRGTGDGHWSLASEDPGFGTALPR